MKRPGRYLRDMKNADPDRKRLWRHIESGILIDGLYSEVNREMLDRAIRDLPEILPVRDLWPALDQHIHTGYREMRNRRLNNYIFRIAATIVFLLSTYLVIELVVLSDSRNQQNIFQEEHVESFLNQVCAAYPKKCREADFIELKSEIIRLNNEKSEVESSIFFNPADASITKINDRINSQIGNLKSQIIDYVE